MAFIAELPPRTLPRGRYIRRPPSPNSTSVAKSQSYFVLNSCEKESGSRFFSRGPDRRNLDSALLSFGRGGFSPAPCQTLGKESPLVDSRTGGFSRVSPA